MANDTEKQKADLDKLGRLVDKYAQSRSLPLLISLAMMIFNVVLMVSIVKLLVAYGMRIGQSGVLIIVILVFLWIFFRLFGCLVSCWTDTVVVSIKEKGL